MRRKTKATLMLVLGFALIAGACAGGGTGEYDLVAEDKLTVCSDIPYAPFEFEEGGSYSGFDVELMEAIGAELDLEVEFIDSGFDSITSGTAMVGNECDIAASAITIRPDREENIDFSDGYFDADQSLMVKKDSGFSTYADLSGSRVGVHLEERDGKTWVQFWHKGWPSANEHYRISNCCWAPESLLSVCG